MATGYTLTQSLAGTTYYNLYTILVADGYTGNLRGDVLIYNANTTPAFVVLQPSGSTAPTNGSDGLRVGNDPLTAPSPLLELFNVDLSETWLYSSALVAGLVVIVTGGRR